MAEDNVEDDFFQSAMLDFSGGCRLEAEDPRWSHLFRSTTVLRSYDGTEDTVTRHLARLVQHNPSTGNILVLLEHAISRLRQIRALTKHPAQNTIVQCCVALRLSRFVFNFMCAHLSDSEIRRQLGLYGSWPQGIQTSQSNAKGALVDGDVIVVGLLRELLQLCAQKSQPAMDWMQDIQLESVNFMLTLFSTQLYNPLPRNDDIQLESTNPFLDFAFSEAGQQHSAMLSSYAAHQDTEALATRLVSTLLHNIMEPATTRDTIAFHQVAQILADRARDIQVRDRMALTPARPVANIAAALPTMAELKAVSETIWTGIASFGSAATSILSLPFSWTRMYSLIFNAAARARGHMSGHLPHPQVPAVENYTPANAATNDGAAAALVMQHSIFENDVYASVSANPLAQRCLLLLLILVHNHRSHRYDVNPFREAFCTLADDNSDESSVSDGRSSIEEDALSNVTRIHISFKDLVSALTAEVPLESSSLMLYTLLQSNPEMLYSILEQNSAEKLVEPVLHGLYQPTECNGAKHLYTLVITVLMCTQDEAFVANSFRKLKLPAVVWYKERFLKNISLGSLAILCLLRTLTFALLSARDEYLLVNVLAALSNISSHIENLHPYAAQRIVAVCIKLARRIVALSNGASDHASLTTIIRAQEPDPMGTSPSPKASVGDVRDYVQALQTLLLLTWQSLRPTARSGNVHMLYSLVHQSQEVSVLLGHHAVTSRCHDAATIVQVTHHFYKFLREQEGEIATSEQAINGLLNAVNHGTEVQLDMRDVVTFSYEEGVEPESFFVPYVWEVTTAATPDLGWHLSRICVFDTVLSPVLAEHGIPHTSSDLNLEDQV